MHSGDVLREDYLKPLGMSANALAKHLGVAASRINDIVLERRGVTADTALLPMRYFGGEAQSWFNLQITYDLTVAKKVNAKLIASQVTPFELNTATDIQCNNGAAIGQLLSFPNDSRFARKRTVSCIG